MSYKLILTVHFYDIPDLQNYKVCIKSDPQLDQRVYNSPLASQVAAIGLDDNSSAEYKNRDIIVYSHSGFSHRIQYYFGCYDDLQHPLLFSRGDIGWHQRILKINKKKGSQLLTFRFQS